MEEDLEDMWKKLNLTEDEKEDIIGLEEQQKDHRRVEDNWTVGKLLTNRSFNGEALMRTLKLVWKLAQAVDINQLEENMFLFKFS